MSDTLSTKQGIIDQDWLSEVGDIRSFMDEDYSVPLGRNNMYNVSLGRGNSQLAWARIGIEKWNMRVIPKIVSSGDAVEYNNAVLARLIPYIRKACKDAVTFGNSTVIIDRDNDNIRVSTPENSFAKIDAFGTVIFTEDLGDICNISCSTADDGSDSAIICMQKGMEPVKTNIHTYTIFYGDDGSHPCGSSRLTNSVRSSIRAASRNKIRAEIASNFYTYPQRVINGAWEEMDRSILSGAKTMASGTTSIQVLPKDPITGDKLDYTQFSSADFTPFITLQEQLATEVATALGINLTELGVVKSGDASNADSVYASHEAISVAIEAWEQEIAPVVQDIVDEYTKMKGIPSAYIAWREPAQPSKASAADAAIKLVSAFPTLADNISVLRWAGLPDDVLSSIKSDLDPVIIQPDANDDEGGNR